MPMSKWKFSLQNNGFLLVASARNETEILYLWHLILFCHGDVSAGSNGVIVLFLYEEKRVETSAAER